MRTQNVRQLSVGWVMTLSLLLTSVGVAVVAAPVPARAATTSIGCPSGLCLASLIQAAIGRAAAGDVLVIGGGTYLGHLTIFKSITLQAAAGGSVTLDGQQSGSVVLVTSGVSVTLAGLTITNGRATGTGGGGIENMGGNLTVVASTVRANSVTSTSGAGGGIYNSGTLMLLNSTVSGNTATTYGYAGGGIYNSGTLTLLASTVNANAAHEGGGLDNTGTAMVANSTLSDNTASVGGGGVANRNTLTLLNSTVTNNTAAVGGGLSTQGTLIITNSLVLGNAATTNLDLDGSASSNSSLVGIPTGSTLASILASDAAGHPLLASNGGPTATILLTGTASTNPAIHGANITACARPPISGLDQRGMARSSAACAMGAVDMGLPAPVIVNSQARLLVRSVAIAPPLRTFNEVVRNVSSGTLASVVATLGLIRQPVGSTAVTLVDGDSPATTASAGSIIYTDTQTTPLLAGASSQPRAWQFADPTGVAFGYAVTLTAVLGGLPHPSSLRRAGAQNALWSAPIVTHYVVLVSAQGSAEVLADTTAWPTGWVTPSGSSQPPQHPARPCQSCMGHRPMRHLWR